MFVPEFKNGTMNHLTELVEFEKQIKNLTIESYDKVEVFFSKPGDQILLRINNNNYCGMLQRGLIHQLGSMAFNFNDYEKILSIWKEEISHTPEKLKDRIVSAFRSRTVILKYFKKNNVNEIYGLVSSQFQFINQIEFRNLFTEELNKITAFKIESTIQLNQYGQVEEIFIPSFCEHNVAYTYRLIYGRNNGYSAIKVDWGRVIKICSNGLTKFEGSKFVLAHKQNSNYTAFAKLTVEEGIKNYNFINQRIEKSSNIVLNQSLLSDFLGGMTIARATKERISDRFKIEQNVTGPNEWSLSQSLTWLAQHEKAIGNFTKGILRDTGTTILENGLENFMNTNHFKTEFDKKYIVFEK